MVQKLNGWCSDEQYEDFMASVLGLGSETRCKIHQTMVVNQLKKNSVSALETDRNHPLTSWKFSPNDALALSKYDQMTLLKERVHTTLGEWHSIDYNDKASGRLGSNHKNRRYFERSVRK